MKKISIYFLIFFVSLMAASCVDPIAQHPQIGDGSFGISLSVACKDLDTKATRPGDDDGDYNENKIDWFDWFVFKDGTNLPIEHGRCSETSTVINMDDYVGSATGISGSVYVIANLPEDQFRHDDENGFQQKTPSGWTSITTLDKTTLEALQVVASFGSLNSSGKFNPQDSFVMTGETAYELNATTPSQTVTAKLDRLAVKVTLDLSVVPAIDEIVTLPNGDAMYTQTWYPVLEDIDIYLSYADNHATIGGNPEHYVAADFFTYNREGFIPGYSYTGSTATTSSVPSVTPTWTNPDWKWSVTGSPFYTYPIYWETSEGTAPFIKIILPWAPYDESAGIVEEEGEDGYHHFVRAGRSRRAEDRKGPDREFYYKVSLPSKTLNGDILQLTSNDWYNLALDVAILGGTSDDLPLEVSGQYYVVNWNTPDFTAGGALMQGRYLDVARDTFYIYGGDGIEIPVTSSHTLDGNLTKIDSARYYNPKSSSTWKWQNLTRNTTLEVEGRALVKFTNELETTMGPSLDCYMMKFDVTIVNGAGLTKNITIIQYPAIYIDSKPGGNVMIDGYFGNVDGHFRSTHTAANNPDQGRYYGSSGTTVDRPVRTPYAPVTRYVTEQRTMTVITISSLGNNTEYTRYYDQSISNRPADSTRHTYLIADPRQLAGYRSGDLANYWRGTYDNGAATPWDAADLSKIKIGDKTTPNLIAPKILVASRWGRTDNWGGGSYNTENQYANGYPIATNRCATYQEAGYPAGRWRLPTEAEIIFIAQLQRHGFIDRLFTSAYNVSASGSIIRVNTGSNFDYWSTNHSITSMRCVYDLWYWGDDPVDGAMSTYTIMP